MTNHDLEVEIEQLAIDIEESIEDGQEILDHLPEFEPRSQLSRKLQRKTQRES